MAAAAAAATAPASRPVGRRPTRSRPGGSGPAGPLPRAAPRRAHRPHHGRPGRDRAAQHAAGRRPRRPGRPWRAARAGPRHGRSSACAGARPTALCAAVGLEPVTTRATTTRVPAQPGPHRGPPAAVRGGRARPGPGPGPPEPSCWPTTPTCSKPWPPAIDPTDARALRRRPAPAGPPGRPALVAQPAASDAERHPPSAAEVERVLAVARGEVVGLRAGRRPAGRAPPRAAATSRASSPGRYGVH